MKSSVKEVVYVVIASGLALVLGAIFWWLPVILVLPTLLVYTTINSLAYILILGFVTELCSWSYPGLFLVSFFIPWFIKKIFKGVEIDFKFSYYGIIFMGMFLQMVLIVGYGIFLEWQRGQGGNFIEIISQYVPWMRTLVILVVTTVFTASASALIFINKRW